MNKILISSRRKREAGKVEEEVPPHKLEELLEGGKEPTYNPNTSIAIQERESIRLLINYGFNEIEEEYRLCDYLLEQLEDIEFVVPVYREILKIFKRELADGRVVDGQFFIQNGSDEIKNEVVDLITERHEASVNWNDKYHIFVPHENDILENVVFTNVLRLKFRVIQKLILDNLSKMKEATEESVVERHFNVHAELKKSEMEISKTLGIVISG